MIRYVYIHRANTFAPAAGDTLVRVARYPEQGEIAHRFHEYGDGTYVLTKSPAVLEKKCQSDPSRIIEQVSDNERPEHDPFQIAHMGQKEGGHK